MAVPSVNRADSWDEGKSHNVEILQVDGLNGYSAKGRLRAPSIQENEGRFLLFVGELC